MDKPIQVTSHQAHKSDIILNLSKLGVGETYFISEKDYRSSGYISNIRTHLASSTKNYNSRIYQRKVSVRKHEDGWLIIMVK